jgi:hypothetical protein
MTAAQIGNLQVRMGIDSAEFSNGVRAIQGSLGSLTGSLKAFAGIAAGALSAQMITQQLGAAINRMDDLGKTAQKIGIPVEELSKLEYAAKLSDVSLESLTSTLSKFSKNIAEVGAGGQNDAGAALKALGISATDAQGQLRPTTALIGDIADEFAVMRDGAGKTAIAMALFGKSGASMIPMLNGGKQAIADAAAEAKAFGIVVSEEAAVAAEGFNDNLTRLQQASNGVTQQVAIGMLPALNSVTDAMVEFAAKGDIAKQAADAISWIMKEAAKGAIFLSQAYTELAEMATFLGEALQRVADGDFAGIGDAWAASQARVRQSLEANTEALRRLNEEGQRSTEWLKGDLPSSRRTQAAPIIPALGGKSSQSVVPITIEDIRGPALELQNLEMQLRDTDVAVNQFANDFAEGLSSSLASAALNATSLSDAFHNLKLTALDALGSIAQQLLRTGLNSLFGIGGTALGGAMGLAGFGGLYANGGTLGAGKWGIAGEAGPEIVHGPATITPMSKMGGQISVSWSPSIVINGSADQRMISSVMAAEREKFKADLPKMIRDARKRGSI